MGLAEILARKKAEAEKAAMKDVTEAVVKEEVKPVPQKQEPVQEAQKQEEKPLTFAEKMALKKKQQEAPAVEEKKEVLSTALVQAAKAETANQEIAKAEEAEANEGNAEIRNAYAEIAAKIDELAELSSTELPGAMSALKKSLMQNPAACELMLDEDLGKMVTALRRIVGEEIVAKKAEKSLGKKPKANSLANMSVDDLLAAAADL